MQKAVLLVDNILSIKDKTFNLDSYKRIFIIGFGKASCKTVQALEDILGERLTGGIVIDKNPSVCRVVEVYKGTHPLPSIENGEVTRKIVDLTQNIKEDDLVIVVVSGGGSALLCWPKLECEQGQELYKTFLRTGGTIEELNVLRKHISEIKGGGLAKLLYGATVVGLIFCDVPGNHYEGTASGPTYFDITTIKDVEKLLEKYSIKNKFTWNETPKDPVYFEKVTNIPFISNNEALFAMETRAKELGYEVISLGDEVYETPKEVLEKMKQIIKPHSIVIAGGELAVNIKGEGGTGGRNLSTCGQALNVISDTEVFIAFASDGIDNKSASAGAIVDVETKNKIKERNISVEEYTNQDNYDELFTVLGDNIVTGPTGSNVSDLYIMLRN